MFSHGSEGSLFVRGRVGAPEFNRLLERHAVGNIAVQLVVGRGLVGQQVGNDLALDHAREQVYDVTGPGDAHRQSVHLRVQSPVNGLVEVSDVLVEVAGLLAGQSSGNAGRVGLGPEIGCAGHCRGERLGSAHAAEPAGYYQPPG